MKFSSWLAIGALVGRELCPGDRNWKDAILAAVIAKNEVVDKDGIARKMIEQGASDGEIEELHEMLDRELDRQKQSAPKKRGFLAAFARGFAGERL